MSQIIKLLQPGTDQSFEISLDKNGSNSELMLFFIGRGNEEYHIDTTMHHQAKGTGSLTRIKGVLLDKSKAEVNGLIKIDSQAGQTQAFLEEKILLIGKSTQARALPKLEIEAKDVKASHAAAVGRLNEEELFYLQSRGLSKAAAERMIITGFFQEALDKIEDLKIRKSLKRQIKQLLNG